MIRPKLNRIWTSTNPNLRRDPGDVKYIQGWVSEIPTYQVLNYLQYKIDTTLLAMAERGIFEWGGDITYGLASVVWDELDSRIYVSTVGSPDKTKAPSTNLSQWSPSAIQVSRASYDAVASAINTHIADVTGNPHNLTAGRLKAYNKNETDAIVAQYRALVLAHSSDKNNPHGVTASQTGAVPATGGAYSGDVIFNGGMFFDVGKTTQVSKVGGIFLQNTSGKIGIDSSGDGVVGTTSSTSKIVTVASYPTLKASQEPNYATPTPELAMNLIGDINMLVGAGSVEDPSPAFNPDLGYCYLYNPTVNKTLIGDTDFSKTGRITIAVDLLSPDSRNPVSANESLKFGTEQISLAGIDNGSYGLQVGGSNYAMFAITGPINTWYRLVVTYDGNTAITYINGVEVSRQAVSTIPTGTNKVILNFVGKPTPNNRRWNVRNFRMWSCPLSAKQISTL